MKKPDKQPSPQPSSAIRRTTGQTAFRRSRSGTPPAAVVARLVGISASGEAWVELPGQADPVPARSTVPLTAGQIGREALVCFVDAPERTAVVTGVLCAAGDPTAAPETALDVTIDRERIVLTAQRELVLRCGKASVALTADGKVVIKGADLLSTASGLHRIRGGAVQIN
jgi:hypothetical protein